MRNLNDVIESIKNDTSTIGTKAPKIRNLSDVTKTSYFNIDDFKDEITKIAPAPDVESDLDVRVREGIDRGVQSVKNLPEHLQVFQGQTTMALGGLAGSEENVEIGRELIKSAFGEIQADEKKFYENSIPLSEKDYDSFGYALGNGVANYGSMLAFGYLTGGVGGLALGGALETGSKAREKIEYHIEKTGDNALDQYTSTQAGKDALFTAVYSAGSTIIEKKFGYGAQRKLFKMPVGQHLKNIYKSALSEGGTETAQELYAVGLDLLGGYIDYSKLPERFLGAVQEGVIGSVLGGTAGVGTAMAHRSQAKSILREELKNTVPAKDLENIVNSVYEEVSDTMTKVVATELVQSESLRNKHGAIYESLKKEIRKQITDSGAYTDVDEFTLSQYIESTAKDFADQVLGEANKRKVTIDDVLKASDITYRDGRLYLQGLNEKQQKIRDRKRKKKSSEEVKEQEEQLKEQIRENAPLEEKEQNLNDVVSSYEGSENFDIESMPTEDKQAIFEAKQEQDKQAEVFMPQDSVDENALFESEETVEGTQTEVTEQSEVQENVEEYDPSKQYNEYDIVKRKLNGEYVYTAYIDESWNIFNSLEEAKNSVNNQRSVREQNEIYRKEQETKNEEKLNSFRRALITGDGFVPMSYIIENLKLEGIWDSLGAKTKANIKAFGDYVLEFTDGEAVSVRLDGGYGKRAGKRQKLVINSQNAIKKLRDKMRAIEETKEELSPETNEAVQDDTVPTVEKEETITKGGKIEDFGEKIKGARKDLWQNFLSKIESEMPSNAEDIKLSVVFPEPNYEKAIANGVSVDALATIKALRDLIPTKPQSVYKLHKWRATVESMREIARNIINSNFSMETVDNILSNPLFKNIRGQVELYRTLGYPYFRNAKGYSIRGALVTQRGEERYPGGIVMFEVRYNNRTVRINGNYFLDSFQDAVDGIKNLLDKPKDDKKTKFDLYSRVGSKEIILGKKVGSGKYLDLHTFDTIEEARKYLADNYDSLVKELEERKQQPIDRGEVNRARIGDDYRKGKDVSPEEFSEMFGFRGVQFGNWVEQKTRVADLNQAYDALVDLSKILNIPTQAISLNGTLGLAFGARGHKGAAAHYESGEVVINLTKMQGAGSLAHEWFHALDNSFLRKEGLIYGDRFATETSRSLLIQHNRIEVITAFINLGNVLSKSELSKRSFEIDKRRSNDYWSTIRELGARAFEQYIKDKAKALGVENDFLVNIVVAEGQEENVYLNENEKAEIYEAFDELFNTLQTRKTEKGIEFYQESFDIADENARLDDIYPEYKGETININGVEKTVYNSNGDRIAMSEPALRNFYNWFGDSKVVDEQGRPLVVYHGTRTPNIREFKAKYEDKLVFFAYKKEFAEDWAKHSPLTEQQEKDYWSVSISDISREVTRDFQSKYGDSWFENEALMEEAYEERDKRYKNKLEEVGLKETIYPVYLRAESTFVPSEHWDLVIDEINKYYETDFMDGNHEEGLNRIKKGHWIYFEHGNVMEKVRRLGFDSIQLEEISGEGVTTIAVFEGNNQIKSTSNRGTYSESDNIYYQKGKKQNKIKGAFDQLTKSIKITSEADYSTYKHEFAHFWLDNIWNYANSGQASENYLKQFNEIKKWLGTKGNYPTPNQHEKFARAYEKYLYNGTYAKSPMGDVFGEYENFIREVYSDISEIDTRAGEKKYKPIPRVVYNFFDSMVSGKLPGVIIDDEPKKEVEKDEKEVREFIKEENKILEENRANYTLKPVQTDTKTGYLTAYGKMTGEQVEAGSMELKDQIEKAENFVANNLEQAERIVNGLEQAPEGIVKNAVYVAYNNLQKKLGNTDKRANSMLNQALELRRMGQEIASQRLAYADVEGEASATFWIKEVIKNKAEALADANGLTVTELSDKIDNAISDGIANNKKPEDIVKQLGEELGVTEFYQTEVLSGFGDVDTYAYSYIKRYVNERLGLGMSKTEAETIIHKADDMLASLQNSMSKTGNPNVDYFVKLKDMENYANSLAPSSEMRVAMSVIGRGNLLASIKSPVTNIVSNFFTGVFRAGTRRINLGVTNSIVSPEVVEEIKDYTKEVFIKTGYDVNNITKDKPRNLILGENLTHSEGEGFIRKLGRLYENTVYKFGLGYFDMRFKRLAFTDYVALKATKLANGDVAKANEIFKDACLIEPKTKEGAEIREEAIQESLIATYQNDSVISDSALAVRKKMDFGVGFGEFIAPFVKTPANVVSMGLKSGFGGVKAIVSEIQRDLKAGKIQPMTKENIDLLVQNGLGILVASLLMSAIDDDDYMPPYALASSKDKQLAKELNIPYNAIRIGNTWVSLDYLGVLASPLVGLLQARREDGIINSIFGYAKSGGIQALSIPAFGEVADIFENIKNSVRKDGVDAFSVAGGELLEQAYARVVPSIVSDVAKALDSYDRETKGAEIRTKIPLVRETADKRVSATTGKAEKLGNPVFDILFGARVKEQVSNPVADELLRLNNAGWGVSLTTVTRSGLLSELDEETKQKVREDFATEYSKDVARLIKSFRYSKADDEEKQDMINKIRRDIISKLKRRYLKNRK